MIYGTCLNRLAIDSVRIVTIPKIENPLTITSKCENECESIVGHDFPEPFELKISVENELVLAWNLVFFLFRCQYEESYSVSPHELISKLERIFFSFFRVNDK